MLHTFPLILIRINCSCLYCNILKLFLTKFSNWIYPKKLKSILRFICLVVISNSCSDKEKPKPENLEITPGSMVLVCNEGNFRWGNASAGILNLSNQKWVEDGFKQVNGRSLGDVLQSATYWNENWWLVVNNSSKIEVVDGQKFTALKTITGLISPRFLLPVSNSKAYISDIYAQKIWILDGTSKIPIGSIGFKGWSEEMVLSENKVWIVCRNKSKVFIINSEFDQLTDSISLPGNSTSIAVSKNDNIWVGFDSSGSKNPGIAYINSKTRKIEKLIYSNERGRYLSHFQTSQTKDSLFFLQNGVFMVRENSSEFPTQNFAKNLSGNWYGMGFDPKRREIYLSDAKDYQQKSRIFKIKSNSTEELAGGIISSRFYFW